MPCELFQKQLAVSLFLMSRPDVLIIGAGFAGSVVARELAERANKKVLIIEQRSHIGGNCYDVKDAAGVLIHQYGPHIFHTIHKHVYDYLSRFTEWLDYQHCVLGNIYGRIVPIPFNLNTLHIEFDEVKATRLEKKLIDLYGAESKVPILELRKASDPEINELAEYVYQNVFLKYTMKQWGKQPHEIDPAVTGRVPVFISRDNRYFQDPYQGMPTLGYTPLFEKLVDHPNITIRLNTLSQDVVKVLNNTIQFEGEPFTGIVVFTGQLDEFFDLRFDRLPYRTLDFALETHDVDLYQQGAVVNYTVDQDFTRITEFKHMTQQVLPGKTTIVKEFSKAYEGGGQIPYYSISNPESLAQYEKYMALARAIPNFHVLGRLAEFKYYNMDAIVDRALALAGQLIGQ
jgi:UDP-galactopyranose mutase